MDFEKRIAQNSFTIRKILFIPVFSPAPATTDIVACGAFCMTSCLTRGGYFCGVEFAGSYGSRLVKGRVEVHKEDT